MGRLCKFSFSHAYYMKVAFIAIFELCLQFEFVINSLNIMCNDSNHLDIIFRKWVRVCLVGYIVCVLCGICAIDVITVHDLGRRYPMLGLGMVVG